MFFVFHSCFSLLWRSSLYQRRIISWILGISSGLAMLWFANPRQVQAASCTSPLTIRQQEIQASLFPKLHRMQVRVRLQVHIMNRQSRLQLALFSLARKIRLRVRTHRRWKRVQNLERSSQTLRFQHPFSNTTSHLEIEVRYQIHFSGQLQYLTRLTQLQLSPQESYALGQWTPRPLFCTTTPRQRRFVPTQFQLWVPATCEVVASGQRLKWVPGGGRKQFHFQATLEQGESPMFVAAPMKRYKTGKSTDAHYQFYLPRGESSRNLRRLRTLFSWGEAFYQRLWGPRRGSEKPLHIVSYGGAHTRIHPQLILLPRHLGWNFRPLQSRLSPLMTLRQHLLWSLARHWWGSTVRGRGRGAVWLNDGLAHYAALQAMRVYYGASVEQKALQRLSGQFLQSTHPGHLQSSLPTTRPKRHTALTKGVLVLYKLHRLLSRAQVQQGMRMLFRSYRDRYVSWKDLKRQWVHLSGRTLHTFFQHWIWGEELPAVQLLQWRCKRQKKQCLLQLALENKGNLGVTIPLHLTGSQLERQTLLLTLPPQRSIRWQARINFVPTRVRLAPEARLLQGIRWRFLLRQARQLRQQHLWKEAHQLYKTLLLWKPRLALGLYGLARWHQQQKLTAEALLLYEQARQQPTSVFSPNWLKLWSSLRIAELYLQKKEWNKARTVLSRLQGQKRDPYGLKKAVQRLLSAANQPSRLLPARKREKP